MSKRNINFSINKKVISAIIMIIFRCYNEPIKQDKELKKISDLDIMKIRKKK